MLTLHTWLARLGLIALLASPPLAAQAGSWQNNVSLGGFNAVNIYTPDTVSPVGGGRALLIVLHGCTQAHTAFSGARLEVAAETHGMVVAVPDAMHKAGFSCWDYWNSTKSRGFNDYAKLIALATALRQTRDIDPDQVYIAGLSSGAAFAAQTACLAPDIFAGVAPSAGPAIGTSSGGAVSTCENVSAPVFKQRCETYAGTHAPHLATQIAVIAHGTSDTTVNTCYNEMSANGFANVYGVGKLPGTSTITDMPGKTAELHQWQDGRVAMLWLNGLGHAWSGGNGASGSYIGNQSINFADFLGGWFAQHNARVSRNLPPEISGLSAVETAGALSITGTASDDDGTVQQVSIALHRLGGGGPVPVQTLDASLSGTSFNASSAPLTDDLYRITAIATDDAGSTSAPAQITVRVGPEPPPAPPVLSGTTVSVSGQCATVSGTVVDANENLSSVTVAFSAGGSVTASLSGTQYSAQHCNLPGGAQSAVVTATDSTALSASDTVAFGIDAGQTGDYNFHIAQGHITWGNGYAACYLAFGTSAFTMRETAQGGGQCRWVADGAGSCQGPVQACSGGGDDGNGDGDGDGGDGGGGTSTASFAALGESKYVKANASGGAIEIGNQAGYALGTGWDGKNSRSVLSFDTSQIPDDAVIGRVTLTVTRASGLGSPWAGGNSLAIDVRTGCFGASCAIGADDYAAIASAGAVATLPQFSSGSATSTEFDAAGRAAINLAGKTQLRLRFASHPATNNYLFLSATTPPTLHVEYSVPGP